MSMWKYLIVFIEHIMYYVLYAYFAVKHTTYTYAVDAVHFSIIHMFLRNLSDTLLHEAETSNTGYLDIS